MLHSVAVRPFTFLHLLLLKVKREHRDVSHHWLLFFLIFLFLEFKGGFFVKGVFPLNNKKKSFIMSVTILIITWWFVNPFYIWCPFYPFISSLNQPMALIFYKVSQDTLFWFSSLLCFLSSVNFMIILNVFKDHKPKHANHKSMAIYIKICKKKGLLLSQKANV